MQKLVSIIIPVYNAEKYINRCLDSVLNQSYKFIEVIVVDDGSVDNSLSIINSYNDKRIVVISQINGGVSNARNNGLSVAKGDFIAFVDADDYILPNCIELLVNALADLDLSGCSFCELSNNGEIFNVIRESKQLSIVEVNNSFCELISGNYICSVWGKLFKREIIKSNSLEFLGDVKYGEDFLFVMEYLKHCNSVNFVSDIMYVYNRSDTSATMVFRKDYLNERTFLIRACCDYLGNTSESIYYANSSTCNLIALAYKYYKEKYINLSELMKTFEIATKLIKVYKISPLLSNANKVTLKLLKNRQYLLVRILLKIINR